MKFAYWFTTVLFSIGISFSAIGYLGALPELVGRLQHLGYPEYFRFIIGSSYISGAMIIAIPGSEKIKEWFYAILCFNIIALIASHIFVGDSIIGLKRQIFLLVLLCVSYFTFSRIQVKHKVNAISDK